MVVERKVVNLALQGGQPPWGVLDRLLEEERLSFEGITASSAGSVNAAVLAHGLAVGGRDEARSSLKRFWKRISETTAHGMLQPSLLDRMKGKFGLEHSPGYLFVDALMYFTSPHFFNPLNHNPVRKVLEEIVDFEQLRQKSAIKLFLCATNVRTGKAKVFRVGDPPLPTLCGRDHPRRGASQSPVTSLPGPRSSSQFVEIAVVLHHSTDGATGWRTPPPLLRADPAPGRCRREILRGDRFTP